MRCLDPGESVIPHELHLFDRPHSLIDSKTGVPPPATDNNNDYPSIPAQPEKTGRAAVYGVGLDPLAAFPPDQYDDLMTYCSWIWPSEWTYTRLYQKINGLPYSWNGPSIVPIAYAVKIQPGRHCCQRSIDMNKASGAITSVYPINNATINVLYRQGITFSRRRWKREYYYKSTIRSDFFSRWPPQGLLLCAVWGQFIPWRIVITKNDKVIIEKTASPNPQS